MRFLILAYSYPPLNNPRAIRWSAIAEQWAAEGHDVDVLCGWGPGESREEVRSGVRVKRVGGELTQRIRARLRPAASGETQASTSEAPGIKAVAGRMVKKLARAAHDLTWKKLYWPDAHCLWHRPAFEAAGQWIEQGRYDAVVSVSIPFTSHLTAFRLRSQMAGATWLVDVGDPFAFLDQCSPNNTALYARKNLRWERQVFSAASVISVTSDETARRYRELFPECADKIHVIGPVATLPDQPRISQSAADDVCRLVYTGTLYRNIRNPTFLLDLYGDLLGRSVGRRLELHLYGLTHDCGDIITEYQRRFGESLKVHGVVSPQEAQAAVASADVLVNLGNTTTYQLPSKVVDYAATGKPILNLVSVADDSSAAFLRDHPCTLTIQQCDAVERLRAVEQIAPLITDPPRVDRQELAAWLKPHSIEHIAGRYLELATPQRPAVETLRRAA